MGLVKESPLQRMKANLRVSMALHCPVRPPRSSNVTHLFERLAPKDITSVELKFASVASPAQ